MRQATDPDTRRWDDQDDEVIAPLVCGDETCAALHALVLRHQTWIGRWIAARGAAHGLGLHDIEDAQQSVTFNVVKEAAARYQPSRWPAPPGEFRGFLHVLVHDRFLDHVKRLRRIERHYERSRDAEYALVQVCCPETDGPIANLELAELRGALSTISAQLDARDGTLWELIRLEDSVANMASRLKLAYRTARRLRRKLLDRIGYLLRNHV